MLCGRFMRRYLSNLVLLFAASCLQAHDLVINEFLAANDTTAADQDGEFDDWIELYNRGAVPVPLGGYHLSDDPGNPAKWTFPDTSLAPDSYLIVWADNDGEQNGLHASFKLSAAGETLLLADPAATVIDIIAFGAQITDRSYGRFPNGIGEFRFLRPTFAGPNAGGGDSAQTVFSDSVVHRIDLQFFVEHWEDSLEYNFELGDRAFLPARLVYNNAVMLDSIGVRYKGNSSYEQSRNTPKKSLEFDFNEYRGGQTLYGLRRLNLHNGMSDPSFMREAIAYRIARSVLPAPRTGFADVHINGQLIGFYILVEQIDRTFLTRNFADYGGNLFKVGDNGATLEYRGENPAAYQAEYELKTNEAENDWSGFITMLRQLSQIPAAVFADSMARYLDLDQCMRLLAFNMVLSNFDSYTGSGRNLYLYEDPASGRFTVVPWDLNEALGVFTYGWNVLTQDVIVISNLSMRPLNRRILADHALRPVYLDFIRELTTGPAAPDSVAALADRLRPLIESHVRADANKLYSDQAFLTNIESDVYVDIGRLIPGIKSFARARHANLLSQLASEWVYPGDTDNNGVVDALDVLPVGIYFLHGGSARTSASLMWAAQRATPWEDHAATFADVNGDGRIDERDVIGIGVNWGNRHDGGNDQYEIDPETDDRLHLAADHLRQIYNSVTGDGEAAAAIRALLESILDLDPAIPAAFRLEQNYPNPFNQATIIEYFIPDAANVTLTVRNILGQIVAIPIDGERRAPGSYRVRLDAADLASGVYFYRLEAEHNVAIRKMVVLK